MLGFNKQTLLCAEFTKDMLQTVVEYFEFFADSEGVLSVEINALGIWIEEPTTKAKKFIGKARYSQRDIENMQRAEEGRRKH